MKLCEKYGIINDAAEVANPKLLHAKTGAAFARELFGIEDDIYGAIRWHTTGKPDMTLLEKIIYLADFVEPTRDFPGVEELRELCFEDIDAAMAKGLEMSLEFIRSGGADSPRPIVLRQKGEQWFLWQQLLMSAIRTPAAQDPWA